MITNTLVVNENRDSLVTLTLNSNRLIPSAVDLKLIFFAESCEEGATSVHFI